MGNFYTNITLEGVTLEETADVLAGREAYLIAEGTYVVVFDALCDEESSELSRVSRDLSNRLDCPALAVFNHDDDILWYQLYSSGSLLDEYDSAPGYFEGYDSPPSGGNASRLCEAFSAVNVHGVKRLLRGKDGEGRPMFAVDLHEQLAELLGLPLVAVGLGYHYLSEGELPEGMGPDELVHLEGGGG